MIVKRKTWVMTVNGRVGAIVEIDDTKRTSELVAINSNQQDLIDDAYKKAEEAKKPKAKPVVTPEKED
jgi:hypothetical protein